MSALPEAVAVGHHRTKMHCIDIDYAERCLTAATSLGAKLPRRETPSMEIPVNVMKAVFLVLAPLTGCCGPNDDACTRGVQYNALGAVIGGSAPSYLSHTGLRRRSSWAAPAMATS